MIPEMASAVFAVVSTSLQKGKLDLGSDSVDVEDQRLASY
jgi:hypothetical protein